MHETWPFPKCSENPVLYMSFGLLILHSIRWLYTRVSLISISHLPGPPKTDWFFGNLPDLNFSEVGVAHIGWQKQYGLSFKIHGMAGEQYLMVSDPKAVQHIYANADVFVRQTQNRELFRMIAGPGLTIVIGEDHRRQRRVMQPAFGDQQMTALFPVFSHHAACLLSLLKRDVEAGTGSCKATLNLHAYASKAALDLIGEAAFGHQFGALENKQDDLKDVIQSIDDSLSNVNKTSLFFHFALEWVPVALIPYLPRLPIKKFSQLGAAGRKLASIAERIVRAKTNDYMDGLEDEKDLMSILVRANAKEVAKKRLSDEEVRSEIASIIIAGYATTANSLAFGIWELAKNLDLQQRLRAEIFSTLDRIQEKSDKHEITFSEYENMPLLVAFMKEVFRFHPASFNGNRQALKDCVIPLSRPVKLDSGRFIKEIPISRGQKLWVNMPGYNRLPEIFGADAYEFNPDRWLDNRINQKQAQGFGLYANLVTFADGPRGCIGWRVAVYEIQTYLINLLPHLEFSLPPDAPRICRSAAITMIPTVEGKRAEGAQLPLDITILTN